MRHTMRPAHIAFVLLLVRMVRGECEEDVSVNGVLSAFRRGDYDCALRTAKATGGRFENQVTLELRSIEKAVKEIKEAVKPLSSSVLAPAYQWAQSGSELYVSVKFAHKFDAPATLVNKENIDEVSFSNRSVVVRASKSSKRFLLELALLRDIDPVNCSWSSASVGRATLTLRKAGPFREWWPRLLASKTKPPNQHVWWDKQEAFEDERDEVEKEEKQRAKDAKKGAKKAAANDTESNATAHEQAPPPPSDGEAVSEDDSSEEDKQAERAANKRRAEIRKAGAAKKKDVDDTAREEKRAINEEAKQRITAIDDEVRKKKDDIDAETHAALQALDTELEAETTQLPVKDEHHLGSEAIAPAGGEL